MVFPHNVSTNIYPMNNQIASSDSSIHLGNVIGPNSSALLISIENVLLSSFYDEHQLFI